MPVQQNSCKTFIRPCMIIMYYIGHVIFEMAAGYELTQTCPGQADYMAVDTRVKPVLEYIFKEGFSHDIVEVKANYDCTFQFLLVY